MMNVLLNFVRKTRMILNWVLFSCHIIGHLRMNTTVSHTILVWECSAFCRMFEPFVSLGSIVLVDLFG